MSAQCIRVVDSTIQSGEPFAISGELESLAEDSGVYVGQVECDPGGVLWAVLYCGNRVIRREQVPSLRRGKRRVADLVLSAAEDFPCGKTDISRPTG